MGKLRGTALRQTGLREVAIGSMLVWSSRRKHPDALATRSARGSDLPQVAADADVVTDRGCAAQLARDFERTAEPSCELGALRARVRILSHVREGAARDAPRGIQDGAATRFALGAAQRSGYEGKAGLPLLSKEAGLGAYAQRGRAELASERAPTQDVAREGASDRAPCLADGNRHRGQQRSPALGGSEGQDALLRQRSSSPSLAMAAGLSHQAELLRSAQSAGDSLRVGGDELLAIIGGKLVGKAIDLTRRQSEVNRQLLDERAGCPRLWGGPRRASSSRPQARRSRRRHGHAT